MNTSLQVSLGLKAWSMVPGKLEHASHSSPGPARVSDRKLLLGLIMSQHSPAKYVLAIGGIMSEMKKNK